jgi:hypothetical protein
MLQQHPLTDAPVANSEEGGMRGIAIFYNNSGSNSTEEHNNLLSSMYLFYLIW